MKKLSILLAAISCCVSAWAQTAYTEPTNPCSTPVSDWAKIKAPVCGWTSTDVRHAKETPVNKGELAQKITLHAWRGERVSAQWVLSSPSSLPAVEASISAISGLPSNAIHSAIIRYVITDELNKDGQGGCGYRRSCDYDSSLVADVVDHHLTSIDVDAMTTRSGLIYIDVPRDCHPGTYTATVQLRSQNATIASLQLSLKVSARTLPEPKDYAFHLDLWQNPYAEARFYGVHPFTAEHFDAMKQDMQHYARAGGKAITASIIDRPWNGQTYDPFASMVTWIKKADGSWMYDYTVFDRWVEFMMSLGIDKQISCYSMVPWRLAFRYLDQATDSFMTFEGKPGEPEYEEFWITMLRDFARHLKSKGWFEITHIAMDERPMDAMLATLNVIRKADPDFKISFAGLHHKELIDLLNDYCVGLGTPMTADEIARRRLAGMNSTFYTCCTEPRPNTFTFSAPAEAEWLGWYAAAAGYDGYLRWALNSWVEQPLLDSRFRTWAAGDCYLIYPDGRSSVRMERLIAGVQAFEKIRILRNEFAGNEKKLKQLNSILAAFDPDALLDFSAAQVLTKARAQLQALE